MIKNAFILFAFAFAVLLIFLPTFSRMQDVKQKDQEYQKRIADLTIENQELLEEKRKLEEAL